MIEKWLLEGTAFGLKAFSAAFIFALCALIVLGFLAALARVFGGGKE